MDDRSKVDPRLRPLADRGTVLLTTFKRDGTPLKTPMSIAVEGDHAYLRTYEVAGKLKRLRHTPEVEVAPSTFRGRPTGPAIRGRVRILEENEEDSHHAAELLEQSHPVLQGVLVPLAHKLKHWRTIHMKLRPAA